MDLRKLIASGLFISGTIANLIIAFFVIEDLRPQALICGIAFVVIMSSFTYSMGWMLWTWKEIPGMAYSGLIFSRRQPVQHIERINHYHHENDKKD